MGLRKVVMKVVQWALIFLRRKWLTLPRKGTGISFTAQEISFWPWYIYCWFNFLIVFDLMVFEGLSLNIYILMIYIGVRSGRAIWDISVERGGPKRIAWLERRGKTSPEWRAFGCFTLPCEALWYLRHWSGKSCSPQTTT